MCKSLIVNTWITKNTPWIIKHPDAPMFEFSKDEIQKVYDLVKGLRVEVNVPKILTTLSLPRYYLVVYNDNEIVDVIGIRHNMTPTKWSYRLGYWHPQCQLLILKSLERFLNPPQT